MQKWTLLILIIIQALFQFPVFAHPGDDDPVLAELNDYLMAIQIMRAEDTRAAEIFKTWKELRTASWKIRELTDDEDLLIHADKVMEQIGAVKLKQQQLLRECRAYFSGLMKQQPTMHFSVDQIVKAEWEDPLFEVQVQHTKVILIEIRNEKDTPAQLTMRANRSDEILFWNKRFTLAPRSSRFTFAVCAPLSEKKSDNVIQLADGSGNIAEARIRLQGIPMVDQPYRLLPGGSTTKVILPDSKKEAVSPPQPFAEAIKFKITDKLTGKALPARVEVKDELGNTYWSPLQGPSLSVNQTSGWRTTLWEFQPGPYFYVGSQAELGVSPAGKSATIYHGFEYKPVTIQIPESGNAEISMERWINMPERGWYSGQTHIHTTHAGMPVQFSRYWPLVSQAEDLHVSAILTLKGEWETHAIYANEFPMGKREAFSTANHIITYGEEYRSNPYGHLAFIGLDYLIQPISSGALGELGGPDYPPNAFVLEEALTQGATTIAAHFGNFTKGVDQIKTPWPSTGFEMPVDIALGKIQMAEIYGNGGQLDVWYDILNCGFKIPATAGPDWAIKDSPRVYVYLGDQAFTLDNWRSSLQKGNSFITKGPMLFFEVNGEGPGSEINAEGNTASFQIKAEALSAGGKTPIEILFNGNVVATGTDIDTGITLNDSGWLAARCEGAHSNPVYVNFKGRPAGQAAPAEKFIQIIDRLEKWVRDKGLFYDQKQKKEVLEVLTQGKKVFEDIAGQARKLGRQK